MANVMTCCEHFIFQVENWNSQVCRRHLPYGQRRYHSAEYLCAGGLGDRGVCRNGNAAFIGMQRTITQTLLAHESCQLASPVSNRQRRLHDVHLLSPARVAVRPSLCPMVVYNRIF